MKQLVYRYVVHPAGFRGRAGRVTATLALLLLACAAVALPALAEDRLERLEISLWPEFDRPAMLVMFRAWLPAGTELPATITLPMPLAAGSPSAAAYRAADGSMLIAPTTLTTEGETIRVTLNTPAPEVRLEYYVALDVTQPVRAYRFQWPGGVTVGQVSFDVLHPWGAADVNVAPAGTRKTLADGRIEERGSLGAWAATDEATIEVVYAKPPGNPAAGGSVAKQPTPAAPAARPAASTSSFAATDETRSDSRWLVLFVVATLTFACGFVLGRWSRRPQ